MISCLLKSIEAMSSVSKQRQVSQNLYGIIMMNICNTLPIPNLTQPSITDDGGICHNRNHLSSSSSTRVHHDRWSKKTLSGSLGRRCCFPFRKRSMPFLRPVFNYQIIFPYLVKGRRKFVRNHAVSNLKPLFPNISVIPQHYRGCCVLQGSYRGFSGTVHERKNRGSRITEHG